MDPEKLVERDRARRLRQLRNAKLQGLVLIGAVIVLVVYAVSSYLGTPKKKAPEKEVPAPVSVAEKPEATPAAPTQPAPETKPVAEEPKSPAVETSKGQASQTSAADTIRRTPPGMMKLNGDAPKPAVPVANVLASIGVTDSEKSKRELPKVNEVKRVLALMSKTSLLSSKLEYVIMKPGIELRMKEYYEVRGQKEPEVGEQVADFEIQMGGDRYLDVVYRNPTRPTGTLRASFMRDEKGMVRLDWESFVGFSAMSMREFRDKKAEDAATMRVFASVDDYFNYEFADSKKFLSVRLRNADGSEAVNGFCEAGGRVATAINARLATASAADAAAAKGEPGAASKRTWAPIIVKVRFPAKAQSDHCVELIDLMHGQWLAPAGLVE